ncbi:hypothetical protein IFR05_006089 [Cadophora sp. M221]|nr:hypothetical protein IFR05_006089 [Cadophora sp. M221]
MPRSEDKSDSHCDADSESEENVLSALTQRLTLQPDKKTLKSRERTPLKPLVTEATEIKEVGEDGDTSLMPESGALRLFNLMPPSRKRQASETDKNALPKRSKASDDSDEYSEEPPSKKRETSEIDSLPTLRRAGVSDASDEGSEKPPSRKREASATDIHDLPKRPRVQNLP